MENEFLESIGEDLGIDKLEDSFDVSDIVGSITGNSLAANWTNVKSHLNGTHKSHVNVNESDEAKARAVPHNKSEKPEETTGQREKMENEFLESIGDDLGITKLEDSIGSGSGSGLDIGSIIGGITGKSL